MKRRRSKMSVPATVGSGNGEPPESDSSNGDLSDEERSVVLSALWIWRGQLGRVGSAHRTPGLGTEEAREAVDKVARKLGGDPDTHFFGLDHSRRR